MGTSLHRLHAIVQGQVQGVFFRAWTQGEANSLKLRGWVRNLPDGSVELVAEGKRPMLEELLKRCHRGPPAARVASVEVEWGPAQNAFSAFEIVP